MKSIILCLLIPLNVCIGYAQTNMNLGDDLVDSVYLDKYQRYLEEDAELISISRFESIERIDKGLYLQKTYHPDKNVLTQIVEFKDYMKRIYSGRKVNYYDNGNLWSEGQWLESRKTGEWKYYYFPNGSLKSHGNYKLGAKDDKWQTMDTLGTVRHVSTYSKGMLNGETSGYNEKGTLIFKKNYYLGKAMDSTIYIQEEYDALNRRNYQKPRLEECVGLKGRKFKKCKKRTISDYVRNEIVKSKILDDPEIMGTVYLTYSLTEEGAIENIIFLRGICNDVEDVCLKMMKNFPKQLPGIRDGQPIKVQFTLPINLSSEFSTLVGY